MARSALDGLNIEVPRGAVGLVGANGAGKTTLLRLALGLLQPRRARSRSSGTASPTTPSPCGPDLGFMPEHDCLPPDQTAADVVGSFAELAGLPPRAARQRGAEVLDLVGLDEARYRPVGGFSTGMKQRTKLAQAIVADPELVLLDEPTAGLDPLGREEMLALVTASPASASRSSSPRTCSTTCNACATTSSCSTAAVCCTPVRPRR